MMDLNLYIAFVVLSTGIIAVPGPNVLFIIATSLSAGRRAGLLAVAGTSTAMAVQLSVAAIGTTALASVLVEAFVWVKWVGVVYLAYLGLIHVFSARDQSHQVTSGACKRTTFWRGFLVSITNPKTILFFGAFLPQFVSSEYAAGPQLAVLSFSFLVLALLLDSLYALSASALGRIVERSASSRNRSYVIGFIYLGASLGLAVTRRADA